MSKRNFPDFISAYCDYARDNWCPDKFHYWSAVSVIAAALERKVWMLQQAAPRVIHYPNMYIMLTAAPGDGKTSAASRAIRLLKEVTSPEGKISFTPTQITHAALILSMKNGEKNFYIGEQGHKQSAAYFYAGECSNALKEIKGGGDIFPFLTQAYDCEDSISKETISRGDETINFPCMNILGCSTFDNLKGMLTDGGILGGFISRFTFVVNQEDIVRHPEIMEEDALAAQSDPRTFQLIEDLQHIFQMTGRFAPDREYRSAFKKFFPENDRARHKKETEKEKAILARRGPAIIKLSMILAASESSDLTLRGRHWDKAIELFDALEQGYARIIEASQQVNTQEGIDAAIIGQVRRGNGSGMPRADVISNIARAGGDRKKITETIVSMLGDSKQLRQGFHNGTIHLYLI